MLGDEGFLSSGTVTEKFRNSADSRSKESKSCSLFKICSRDWIEAINVLYLPSHLLYLVYLVLVTE